MSYVESQNRLFNHLGQQNQIIKRPFHNRLRMKMSKKKKVKD